MANEKYELLLMWSVLFTGIILSFGSSPMLGAVVLMGMLAFWRDVNKRTLELKKVKIHK